MFFVFTELWDKSQDNCVEGRMSNQTSVSPCVIFELPCFFFISITYDWAILKLNWPCNRCSLWAKIFDTGTPELISARPDLYIGNKY